MFFNQETEICNFADDTTIYSCSPDFEEGTLKLSNDTHLILNWFRINSVVANHGKFQIMFLRFHRVSSWDEISSRLHVNAF